MKKFVVVAGNIGVGKSTLVTLLSQRLGWQPFYEPEGENPYLADFYQDMRTWAFHSQVFFLTRRLRTHRKLLDHPTSVIQDRSMYEDAEVFAANSLSGAVRVPASSRPGDLSTSIGTYFAQPYPPTWP